jgi:hypothetical protein
VEELEIETLAPTVLSSLKVITLLLTHVHKAEGMIRMARLGRKAKKKLTLGDNASHCDLLYLLRCT